MKALLSGAVAALSLLACTPSFAADAPAPTAAVATPKTLDLARRYMVAIHMDQTLSSMMRNMAPTLVDGQINANPDMAENMTPEMRQALIEVVNETVMEKAPALMDKTVHIMAEIYTEQELTDLVAFYEGPTGQALMRKQPLMMQRMPEIMGVMGAPDPADIKARLCKKLDCNAKLPKANKS